MTPSELPPTTNSKSPSGHEEHCFVVMPFGRGPVQQKWFKGWFEVVIKPTAIELGYEVKLSANEEDPVAINDEIRSHLVYDPMVVVDLAGREAQDDPNPNVMYELGIRHALGLPLVIMGWRDQRLPFDVSNQRAILEERDLLDLEPNRMKLRSAILAAREGRYYKPMEAVARYTTIRAAAVDLGEDSLLGALAGEIRDLRATVAASAHVAGSPPARIAKPTLKTILRKTPFYKEAFQVYIRDGGTMHGWGRLLSTRLEPHETERLAKWGVEQWRGFVAHRAVVASAMTVSLTNEDSGSAPDPDVRHDLVDKVRPLVPAQPWPPGIHRTIAAQLGERPTDVSLCIKELIRRGEFLPQVDGELLTPE